MKALGKLFRIIVTLFIILSIVPYLIPLPNNVLTIEELSTSDSRFATVNNTVIHHHYFKSNQAVGTVVFVHGLGGSLFSFRDNTSPLLEAGYDVLLVDLPGFGLSERSLRANYSNQERAELLLKLVEQLGVIQPIHWVGHSMGGSIISWLPTLDPTAAASLTLVAAPFGAQPETTWARVLFQYPPLRQYLKIFFPRFITKERIGSLLSSAYGRSLQDDEILGYMQPLQIRDTHNTWVGLTRDRSPAVPDFGSIAMPVLVLWGAEDSWVSPENAPLWCAAVPDCKLHVIADAGHNTMETHTNEFNATLLSFIRSMRSADQTNP